jgi:hypothetical protein
VNSKKEAMAFPEAGIGARTFPPDLISSFPVGTGLVARQRYWPDM